MSKWLNNTSYEVELNNRIRDVKTQIYLQEKYIDALPTSHPTFMDEYAKLNDLRLNLLTIQSRRQNRNHFPGGYEPAQLIFYTPNNNIS